MPTLVATTAGQTPCSFPWNGPTTIEQWSAGHAGLHPEHGTANRSQDMVRVLTAGRCALCLKAGCWRCLSSCRLGHGWAVGVSLALVYGLAPLKTVAGRFGNGPGRLAYRQPQANFHHGFQARVKPWAPPSLAKRICGAGAAHATSSRHMLVAVFAGSSPAESFKGV